MAKFPGDARTACAATLLMLLGVGCAEGYPRPDEVSAPLMSEPIAGASGEGGGGGSAGGLGEAGGAGQQPFSMFMGDPCERGTIEACTCTDGVSAGQRSCLAEPESPTGGAFGECARCKMPNPPAAGSGGAGGAGTGGGGSGGGGGSTAGSGAAGSGGSGSSGSGGDEAGSGGSGSSPSGCDPDDCEDPLFGSACCTRDDECGVRLLLICNAR